MTLITVNGEAFQETDSSNLPRGEASQEPEQHLNHKQETAR
ncbi:hypothetical protein B0G74_8475 [Paraburkholderia sp. BL9I2N2]|nr:hypothetical protein B0G74_8475 [Paraburkholderia sp. BL9I2N2]